MSTELLKQYLRSFDHFSDEMVNVMFQGIHVAVSSSDIPEDYQTQELNFFITVCKFFFAAYCIGYCDMDAGKAMETSQKLVLRIFREVYPEP